MKKIILSLFICSIVAITGFKSHSISKDMQAYTGVYGGGGNGCSIVSLTLNEDQTFHFVDNTVASKKVDVSGKWKLKNKSIVLTDENVDYNFRDHWKIDSNEKCIKSRKGINFYRLCKK